MAVIVYNNRRGFKEVREVPAHLPEKDWYMGVLLGPPDLTELPLHMDQIREINNMLVEIEIVTYEQMSGRRSDVYGGLVRLGYGESEAKQLRNDIHRIYQQEYLINRRG